MRGGVCISVHVPGASVYSRRLRLRLAMSCMHIHMRTCTHTRMHAGAHLLAPRPLRLLPPRARGGALRRVARGRAAGQVERGDGLRA